MQRLDRILAVIDPTVDVQAGAAKAARLARLAGASLELFNCDVDPAQAGDAALDERILRRIAASEPDLVFKDTHHHSVLRRALFSSTDWNLVRRCPVPLLLSRTADWGAHPRVLAALDPGHHGDKPAALDHDVLEAAQLMARQLEGDVEAVHVFFPAALLAATSSMGGVPLASDMGCDAVIESERARMTAAMREIAQAHGLADQSIHVLQGSAAEMLPRIAAERQVDLLVMGAVSRSRLREFLIGSTAERVLDHLPCDVLIVKSVDFREKLPF